jgi:DNA-binding HxlR family transcriptional regulator
MVLYLPSGNYGEHMQDSAAICDFPPKKQALLHEILERIADKWTLLVIEALDGEGELRFSDLQRRSAESATRC